ncbi:UNVERIFIED_CONTAM: hypothetical protein Sradi_6192000 [Sesamum radiatum]|uniref:Uncharacterized protein n=1 Tax=Sesamum radiatum TaxID=300843 RepID=A0AAW2K8Q3_SESRA
MCISWGHDGGLQGPALGSSKECLEYPEGKKIGQAASGQDGLRWAPERPRGSCDAQGCPAGCGLSGATPLERKGDRGKHSKAS